MRIALHVSAAIFIFGLLVAFFTPHTAWAQLENDELSQVGRDWLAAFNAGKFIDAERIARVLKANDERFRPNRLDWQGLLGVALNAQARYDEAEPLLKSYLEYCRKKHGSSAMTVESLVNLGVLNLNKALYEQSRLYLEEAVAMGKQVLGPDHQTLLIAQLNLGALYGTLDRKSEAAKVLQEVVDGLHRTGSRDISGRLTAISNLARIYQDLGRFDHAEKLYRYGLEVTRSLGGTIENPAVAEFVYALGSLYASQNRADEGRPLLEAALAASERALGPDHPTLSMICGNLSMCYDSLGDLDKAITFRKRALNILLARNPTKHIQISIERYNYGRLLIRLGKYDEAETVLRDALTDAEKYLPPEHIRTARLRTILADALHNQKKDEEAARLVEQALANLPKGVLAEYRHDALRTKASLTWHRGDHEAAIQQLRQAIDEIEAARAFAGGGDVERAATFAEFAFSYETLLGYLHERGDAEGALNTIERVRARTFLEALNLVRVDLQQGHSGAERAASQQLENQLRAAVTKLEGPLSQLPAASAGESSKLTEHREILLEDLASARDMLYQFERDLRNNSPAYRQLIAVQPKLPTLAEVQTQLLGEKGLLLSYFLGGSTGRVLVSSPTGSRVISLKVSDEDGKLLGIVPGTLSRPDLQQILIGDGKTGVLSQLTQPVVSDELTAKLATLYRVLIPEEVRQELTDGKLERLVIVPDGPLALLPMEVLVVEQQPGVKYLLDVAPPIQYGPSAAVLMSLAGRPVVPPGATPILTLGNPQYGKLAPTMQTTGDNDLLARAARSKPRSSSYRTHLTPLPYSGTESKWVAEVFRKEGAESIQLFGAQATEAQLRANITGRQIVHLACHGMSDDAYGNFFGLLAVAPGASAGNPHDDGQLTLAEIYELDLKGCELAILSACMTNHGPEQQGEGVWALSRGFLVAGARRVIASNWVVDDKAGASLISVCCSSLTQARKNDMAPDYARALRDAKRWVRNHDEWQSPYYWGTFVLVGPN